MTSVLDSSGAAKYQSSLSQHCQLTTFLPRTLSDYIVFWSQQGNKEQTIYKRYWWKARVTNLLPWEEAMAKANQNKTWEDDLYTVQSKLFTSLQCQRLKSDLNNFQSSGKQGNQLLQHTDPEREEGKPPQSSLPAQHLSRVARSSTVVPSAPEQFSRVEAQLSFFAAPSNLQTSLPNCAIAKVTTTWRKEVISKEICKF